MEFVINSQAEHFPAVLIVLALACGTLSNEKVIGISGVLIS